MRFVDHAMTVLLIAAALGYTALRVRRAIVSARARRDCSPDCCR